MNGRSLLLGTGAKNQSFASPVPRGANLSAFRLGAEQGPAGQKLAIAQVLAVIRTDHAQIRLLLDYYVPEFRPKVLSRQNAMLADHSARGLLKSGATIKATLRIIEETATEFLDTVVPKIADVNTEAEAFNMVVTELTLLMRGWDSIVKKGVRLAQGGAHNGPQPSAAAREADRRFLELQQRVLKLAEVRKIEFVRPAAPVTPTIAKSIPSASPRNNGGKPLAAHWDAMWAEVAVRLWNGDLKPKSQADVKRAMLDWFNQRGIDIGDTAVTSRARQLWQAMEAAR